MNREPDWEGAFIYGVAIPVLVLSSILCVVLIVVGLWQIHPAALLVPPAGGLVGWLGLRWLAYRLGS